MRGSRQGQAASASLAATEYAEKRAAAFARANAIKAQRDRDGAHSSRRGTSPVSTMHSGSESTSVVHRPGQHSAGGFRERDNIVSVRGRGDGEAPGSAGVYEPGIPGATVRINSFGDTAERIQIRAAAKTSSFRMQPASSSDFQSSSRSADHRDAGRGVDYGNPPVDPQGRLVDMSDRPISCSSYDGKSEVVFGCSDHALYAIDLDAPRKGPTKLYSKRWGHADWVTGCTHLSSGRVLSCGMDKLCLWSADKRRCQDLHYHNRSISGVAAGPGGAAYSSSYDCTVAVWNLSGGERATEKAQPVAILKGHKSPIITLKSGANIVASGGKDGALVCWDSASADCLIRTRAHEASVTALCLPNLSQNVISGGSDGLIKIWDARTKSLLSNNRRHSDAASGGPAPVADIQVVGEHLLVSGGADGAVVIADQRRNGAIASFQHCQHGVYKVQPASDGKCVFVGDGAGMMFCYDVIEGKLRYGLGASSDGAVKCIEPISSRSQVVTAGEDGNVLCFQYE